MRRASRLRLLRIVATVGLVSAAFLAADVVRPGRRFCPIEGACDAARSSALGSVLGVPTSVLGVVAFGGLLVLTFARRARALLRPAGAVAAVCGLGLFAFQVVALDALCPWCVVADAMGVAAGVVVLVGPPIAPRSARRREWVRWAVAGALAVALPLALPRGSPPSWLALGESASPASAPESISVVEYLNPFCVHCRATHARLARALASVTTPVGRERLYVWGSSAPPLWAKACVCAQDQGGGEDLERPFFRELLAARGQGPAEIWAAAARAGLDPVALEQCVARGGAEERLARVRRRVQAARVAGLPTLDIGARRLQGEQTEEELRAALAAAEADLHGRSLR